MNNPNSPLKTLSAIEEFLDRMQSEPSDISTLLLVSDKETGLALHVGPMSKPDHEKWQNLRYFEERKHEQSGAKESGAPLHRQLSDEHLMMHAVWTEDGEQVSKPVAQKLLTSRGFGPFAFKVLEAAAGKNPPRQYLVNEVAQLWGANSTNIIFWRVVKEMGLFRLLLDHLTGDENERARAEQELKRIEESIVFWEAGFQCEEIAKVAGFETYEHMARDSDE